jgi:hypothetical protein
LGVSLKFIVHIVEDCEWRRVTAKGRVLKRVRYDTVLTKFTKKTQVFIDFRAPRDVVIPSPS